ncbi:MAG: CHAP domain-containing protein [Candidatus Dormibacteraceae bacterium]
MKMLLVGLILLVTFPAVVGSTAATLANGPHSASASALFPWVPKDGFPDHFPYGWCTWWAAYNHRVTWNGNAGDWLANASAQGFHTQPTPSVGAIAVYRPNSSYSPLGHVAVVIAISPTTYTVSEMNFIGWGQVSTRTVRWPDPHLEGFIPLTNERVT